MSRDRDDTTNSMVVFGLGTMVLWGAVVVTVCYTLVADEPFAVTESELVFSVLAGVAAAIGVLSTFIGVSTESTTIVSTGGGMYFVTAAVIGIAVLGDSLSLTKAVGIGLAILALVVVNR